MADAEKAFLGVGWAFPIHTDADGSLATTAHEEDIDQAIRIILGTNPGERVMRPDFGAGLDRFLFEPVNASTMASIQHGVEEALITWEPRIDVEEVRVTAGTSYRRSFRIEVTYRVRATNSLHNLVYPFYVDEGRPR